METTIMTFANFQILKAGIIPKVRKELEAMGLLDSKIIQVDKRSSVGDLGCDFRQGAFIVDAENRRVYKTQFPNYYEFLKKFYNY